MSTADRANAVELFRKALMKAHADDWDMDTVAEAAHVCAGAAESLLAEVRAARLAIEGCGCPAPYDACTHDEPLTKTIDRLTQQLADRQIVLDQNEAYYAELTRLRSTETAARALLDWWDREDLAATPEAAALRAALSAASTEPDEPLSFTYTNYRGDTAIRRVVPRRVWFGSTEWHPEPQWFLDAHDLDRGEQRSFPLVELVGSAASAPTDEPTPSEQRSDAVNLRVLAAGIAADKPLADGWPEKLRDIAERLFERADGAEANGTSRPRRDRLDSTTVTQTQPHSFADVDDSSGGEA